MGIVDDIKRIFRPYDDEDEEYEDEEFPDLSDHSEAAAYQPPERKNADDRRSVDDRRGNADDRRNKFVNIHATTQLKVVLVKPESEEEAQAIADHLKQKHTVVVNMESMGKEGACHLVDFLRGVTYASEGNMKKIATCTYIITPYLVDLSGDMIRDELENNGLYF